MRIMGRNTYFYGWVALFAGVLFILNAALLLQRIRENPRQTEAKILPATAADLQREQVRSQHMKELERRNIEVLDDLEKCQGTRTKILLENAFAYRRIFLTNQCAENLFHHRKNSSDKVGSRTNHLRLPPAALPIGVLVLTHARPQYLQRTLESVFASLPSSGFVVVISQDGDHKPTVAKIDEWRQKSRKMHHGRDILHIQRLEREAPPPSVQNSKQGPSCFYIAGHYKFALSYVFNTLQLQSVIIVEDDLEVSPDFFQYFLRMQPLLLSDPSLYAISAWHDNSRPGIVKDPEVVMRSEFFPGLGWMMSRSVWLELEPVWPNVYWDDWMREEAQRKGRDSLRPEVSRTTTFGEEGATAEAATYDLYWKKMIKSTKNVDWSTYPVEILEKNSFDRLLVERLESALRIDSVESIKSYDGKMLMLTYSTQDQFGEIALKLGLFTEWNRFPRGAYRGIVEFWSGNNKIIFAPGSVESIILEIKQNLKAGKSKA